MAVTKVVKKTAEIDGKPIEWNVLAITGFMNDDFQTLELKLTKTEAMLANLLLGKNDEEVNSRKSTDEEEEDFLGLNKKK